jgi:hypothetical protein
MSFYPNSFAELVGFITALVPVVLWALSAWTSARIKSREKRRDDWKRIHELFVMVSNSSDEKKFGAIEQRLAMEELKDFRRYKKQINNMAVYSRKVFLERHPGSDIVEHLDRLEESTRKGWRPWKS